MKELGHKEEEEGLDERLSYEEGEEFKEHEWKRLDHEKEGT
jgi:hypothetical protein